MLPRQACSVLGIWFSATLLHSPYCSSSSSSAYLCISCTGIGALYKQLLHRVKVATRHSMMEVQVGMYRLQQSLKHQATCLSSKPKTFECQCTQAGQMSFLSQNRRRSHVTTVTLAHAYGRHWHLLQCATVAWP